MRSRILCLAVGLAVAVTMTACDRHALVADNLSCTPESGCIPGWVCDPATSLCVQEGDCTLGVVTDCASCGDDCTTTVANATATCMEVGTGAWLCDYDSCDSGFFDTDGQRQNGCECAPIGTEIACNGIDEDCVGGDEQVTGQPDHCADCADDCLAAADVTAAICDTAGAPPVCVITDCANGKADIDGFPATGCEADCIATGSEICDGLDNDCNGSIDDVLQADVDTYCNGLVPGSMVTQWSCVASLCTVVSCATDEWDANADWTDGCEYTCTQTGVETCDGVDQDCNNIMDDVPDIDGECAGIHTTATEVAVWQCLAGACDALTCNGGFVDTDGLPGNGCEEGCTSTGSETCNGLDDDCSGTPDDVPQAALDSECAALYGGAQFVQAWACTAGVCAIGACVPNQWDDNTTITDGCEYACAPTVPSTETCDGVDNDCDQDTDAVDADLDTPAELLADCQAIHTLATGVQQWDCNTGVCEILLCNANLYDDNLTANDGCEYACNPTTAGAEICDGEDNDCNGETDILDVALDTQAEVDADCGSQHCTGCEVAAWTCSGACTIAASGCTADNYDDNGLLGDGCEYACAPTTPGPEICDGEDNDCNGEPDGADQALDTQAEIDAHCAAVNCTGCDVTAWACNNACETFTCTLGTADVNGLAIDGCEGAGCTAESDVDFCIRLGASCGSMTALDNCGVSRTVDCGSCTLPDVCGGAGAANVCGSWWDCAWSRRLPITVSTGSAGARAGYPVSFAFNHQALVLISQSLASGDDVRVVYRDVTGAWTEIDRVLEPESTWGDPATTIWFAIANNIPNNNSDDQYFLYLSNASAGLPPADENVVFHFADFFDRADDANVGPLWTLTEAPANIDLIGNALTFVTMNNENNRPVADARFSPITTGTWAWRFGFDWTRALAEGIYSIHMQLGDANTMDNPPATTGGWSIANVGPSLVSAGTAEGMTNFEGFGYEEAGAVTESQVISGRAVIRTLITMNNSRYDLEIDGAVVDTNINFSANPAELSMIRFMTWQVNTFRFTGRRFEYVLLRPVINPEPSVGVAANESKPASCP